MRNHVPRIPSIRPILPSTSHRILIASSPARTNTIPHPPSLAPSTALPKRLPPSAEFPRPPTSLTYTFILASGPAFRLFISLAPSPFTHPPQANSQLPHAAGRRKCGKARILSVRFACPEGKASRAAGSAGGRAIWSHGPTSLNDAAVISPLMRALW